ncbi:mannose-binding protein C-like isoform X1 [Coccinella septempunctata]|uniref:mannose-binding protein C-like isoform X1 n=1 Tax=Coccinella septempunctata TaxID=41139 RepID=UPI001D07FCDF|nr:mannose-binding protein C-like isoform X1 [Coccinella septempunctata]
MNTFIFCALIMVWTCMSSAGSNNFRNSYKDNGYHLDYREVARQNKITEQILQNYLEKRLFPHRRKTSRTPSVWDILPKGGRRNVQSIQDQLRDVTPRNESLESGESENVQTVYDDDSNEIEEDCPNCIEDSLPAPNRWTMPLLKLGEKRYYLGIFFKANYFRAMQYCRFHGMHLASISSQEENDKLEKYINDFGFGNEHFWTSGTDLADEGKFFWMATGRPVTFTNWNAGEPNNFQYENGEEENCLELWNRDGRGLKWNDSPCSFETYFVCEVQ